LALATPGALADPEARKLADRGFDAFDRGEYATAISYFERAYELAPKAGLLFNIAQSYRKLGASGCERALEYYRRYRDALAERGDPIDEGLRARIVEMQACVDGAEPEPAPEPDTSPAPLTVEAPPPSSRRTTGWILAGAGAAAIAAAAITGGLALDRESDLEPLCPDGVCPPQLADYVQGYDRLRFTALAAGAAGLAALAAGGYLLWRSAPAGSATGVVGPAFGRATIGVRCAF
jgi:tetratricopeptide (TPR) repeat protein